MLRYIYGDELDRFCKLRDTMFKDRAMQFGHRLHWDVAVDEDGFERDEYDAMNPLYAIWQRPDGSHGGSMRFLPTTAQTMVNDHFLDLTDGVEIRHPLMWECTRFCQAQDADARISALLMLAAIEIGIGFHLSDIVGVFDARMVRIYRRLGWEPTVLGTQGKGRNAISVGLWECSPEVRQNLLRRAGISQDLAQLWFDRAFGRVQGRLAMTG